MGVLYGLAVDVGVGITEGSLLGLTVETAVVDFTGWAFGLPVGGGPAVAEVLTLRISIAPNSPATASEETPRVKAALAASLAIFNAASADAVDTSSGFWVSAAKLVAQALTVCRSGFSIATSAPNPPMSCPRSAWFATSSA